MEYFYYKNGKLYCENKSLDELAEEYGTPLYVYSSQSIKDNFFKLKGAFSDLNCKICYSVKSNSNLSVIKLIDSLGGWFDIVSLGEMIRVKKAVGSAEKCVFAGVGKRPDEIEEAIKNNIYSFTVESIPELELINKTAKKLSKIVSFALRINPDVDPKTHKYITTGKKENKFGIDMETALETYKMSVEMENIIPEGVHMHIGSQMTDLEPFGYAIEKMKDFIKKLRSLGINIKYFDIGGGFGIKYKDEIPLTSNLIKEKVAELLKPLELEILIEPGRFISGNAGVLLTKVLYIKESGDKKFAIVDAAMNDLIRPSLYQAYHNILPADKKDNLNNKKYDIVGPICESGDYFAKEREIPEIFSGDLLAVMSAGAYGFTMASNYNTRLRPAEVMVENEKSYLIRERETFDYLLKPEKIIY